MKIWNIVLNLLCLFVPEYAHRFAHTPQGGDGQFLMDNSYLVAAGLPPRRVSLQQIVSQVLHPAS